MLKTKRKRAVVLALIAFFCTATITYVAVDWQRLGGGFLAFLRGKGEPRLASGGQSSGSHGAQFEDLPGSHSSSPSLPPLAPARSHRRHLADASGGASGHKTDEDLFKFGDPAAGGIAPGNFIVAQNDVPTGGGSEGGAGPSPSPSGAPESGGGVTSPAPAPTGGTGDSGLPLNRTPTSAPPSSGTPTPPPAAPTPPPAAPAPAPTQSGTSDTDPPPPVPPVPPVSAVPEASPLAMMSLGALFLAVAAQRRRKKNG